MLGLIYIIPLQTSRTCLQVLCIRSGGKKPKNVLMTGRHEVSTHVHLNFGSQTSVSESYKWFISMILDESGLTDNLASKFLIDI